MPEQIPTPASSQHPDDRDLFTGEPLRAPIVSVVDRTLDQGIDFAHKMSVKTNSPGLRRPNTRLCRALRNPMLIKFRLLEGDVEP